MITGLSPYTAFPRVGKMVPTCNSILSTKEVMEKIQNVFVILKEKIFSIEIDLKKIYR